VRYSSTMTTLSSDEAKVGDGVRVQCDGLVDLVVCPQRACDGCVVPAALFVSWPELAWDDGLESLEALAHERLLTSRLSAEVIDDGGGSGDESVVDVGVSFADLVVREPCEVVVEEP